jgi:hypothetical protein
LLASFYVFFLDAAEAPWIQDNADVKFGSWSKGDIFRVYKHAVFCKPECSASEKSGLGCVHEMMKERFGPVIIFLRYKNDTIFYDVSYTIYSRFLCSGTHVFVL